MKHILKHNLEPTLKSLFSSNPITISLYLIFIYATYFGFEATLNTGLPITQITSETPISMFLALMLIFALFTPFIVFNNHTMEMIELDLKFGNKVEYEHAKNTANKAKVYFRLINSLSIVPLSVGIYFYIQQLLEPTTVMVNPIATPILLIGHFLVTYILFKEINKTNKQTLISVQQQ